MVTLRVTGVAEPALLETRTVTPYVPAAEYVCEALRPEPVALSPNSQVAVSQESESVSPPFLKAVKVTRSPALHCEPAVPQPFGPLYSMMMPVGRVQVGGGGGGGS